MTWGEGMNGWQAIPQLHKRHNEPTPRRKGSRLQARKPGVASCIPSSLGVGVRVGVEGQGDTGDRGKN